MRISGGIARGIPIKVPKDNRIRPALDQVRESVFSSLGDRVQGAAVLDLFAGTGSYGLEALSRGAETITFIELEKKSADNIKVNIQAVLKSMGLTPRDRELNVFCRNVMQWEPHESEQFDLIFADPPYSLLENYKDTIFNLATKLLEDDGLLLLEAPSQFDFCPENWIEGKKKKVKKGSPRIIKYQKVFN